MSQARAPALPELREAVQGHRQECLCYKISKPTATRRGGFSVFRTTPKRFAGEGACAPRNVKNSISYPKSGWLFCFQNDSQKTDCENNHDKRRNRESHPCVCQEVRTQPQPARTARDGRRAG